MRRRGFLPGFCWNQAVTQKAGFKLAFNLPTHLRWPLGSLTTWQPFQPRAVTVTGFRFASCALRPVSAPRQ